MSQADNTVFSKVSAIAVATTTEADNADMIGRHNGLLTGIDTSSFTTGGKLYLSTAGTLTATHPSGIDAVVIIGYAVRIHATVGSIFVDIENQTIAADFNGTVRHQIVNQNA